MESTEQASSGLYVPANSSKPCVYLRNKGAHLIHKILAIAKCSASSRKLICSMKEELDKLLPLSQKQYRLLDCSACEGFMNHPICLPCGHSLCHLCLEKASEQYKQDTIVCPRCQEPHPKTPVGFLMSRKPNLLLQNLYQKCCPSMLECCTNRELGNKFAQGNSFITAIEYYNKAFETGISDHRVLSNRSRAYLAVGNIPGALEDADQCCCLRPLWPKGHYRRAMVLTKLGHHNEAAAAFLLSLHLGGGEQSVYRLLCEVLDDIVKIQKLPENYQHIVSSVVSIAIEKLTYYQNIMLEKEEKVIIDGSQMDIGDLECVLCACLLFNPVTVSCGHTFCQSCLARLFDHSSFCPVCRSPLVEMFSQHTQSSGKMSIDVSLDHLIQTFFSEMYLEKKAYIEADMLRKSRIGLSEAEELPIFVCSLAFPGMHCPLHIYEPRYRLMIRRCIETNSRRFGMCLPCSELGSDYSDYGTILFISSLEHTPDGRSLVTTIGEKRFQVLERKSTDGYGVARIRFITDEPVHGEEAIASLRALQAMVYDRSRQWLQSLPLFSRNVCCPLPPIDPCPESCPDGPTWVWWFVNAIPISTENKIKMLQLTSLRSRLLWLTELLPVLSIPHH